VPSFLGTLIETAWGFAPLAVHGDRVRAFVLPQKKFPRRAKKTLEDNFERLRWVETTGNRVEELIRAYFAGERVRFDDVKLDYGSAGPFARAVYNALRKVPFGRVVTYAELARRAGKPRAARACGTCLARNPLPLIVPCHRVVRADRTLGGFSAAGGTRLKRGMLVHEGVAVVAGKVDAGALIRGGG